MAYLLLAFQIESWNDFLLPPYTRKSHPSLVKNSTGIPLAIGLAFAGLASVQAAVISPSFGSFGQLSGATFGGSDIPNTSVAITTIEVPQIGTVTLGLTAHQRYSNPPVNNNGAGVFTAVNGGDDLNFAPDLARWNVGYYVASTGSFTGYTFQFFYDTDSAAGNDVSTSFNSPLPSLAQDSTNLGFGFYGGSNATNGHPFDPGSNGQYSFALVVKNAAGREVGRTAIQVNAGDSGSVPDGGMTAVLLGFSMLGLGGLKRKFQS